MRHGICGSRESSTQLLVAGQYQSRQENQEGRVILVNKEMSDITNFQKCSCKISMCSFLP
jgi:hypothetical protein